MFEAVQAKGDKGFVRLVTNFGGSSFPHNSHSTCNYDTYAISRWVSLRLSALRRAERGD